MPDNLEQTVKWECHTSRKIQTWDYVYTQEFKDGNYPMYKCRCCGVDRYGAKIDEKEV